MEKEIKIIGDRKLTVVTRDGVRTTSSGRYIRELQAKRVARRGAEFNGLGDRARELAAWVARHSGIKPDEVTVRHVLELHALLTTKNGAPIIRETPNGGAAA